MSYPFDAVIAPATDLATLTLAARLSFNPAGIPECLISLSQWTCWRFKDEGKGKPGKPPIDARTGRYASSKDPSTWTDFETAIDRWRDDDSLAGLNLMLNPADRIALIDIDDYGDSPDPTAADTLNWFTGTYAEKSPSGGLHIFAIGECPVGTLKTNGIYEVKRTITVTGNRIADHCAGLTDQQVAIDRYCAERLTRKSEPTDTEKNVQRSAPADFSFVSVGSTDYARRLELALTNSTISALYHGDISAYGNRSDAEIALALRLLTFADGDTAVVADWLDRSQCGKWLERNKDTGRYREGTLTAALRKWDGLCFEDKRRSGDGDLDHGHLLAEALLKGRDKAGQAGHSDRDTGQPEMSGSEPPVKNPLFMDAADLLLTIQPPQWLIKRFVSADSLTTLFGSPGCGKSFVAIDMACCIAAGQEWNGNRTATGQVLYIAGEGHVGFARRLTAWQGVHGIIPPNRLFVSTRSIAFNPAGLQAVLDAIAELSDVPVLIVIDTLATVIDGNENDAADMARFIRALKAMQVRTQAAVLVVHHTGHGDKSRARGHSSLNGAIDTELKLERTDGNGTLTCTKQKDGEEPQPVGYALTQAVIGTDEDGDDITSCTVTYSVADTSDEGKRKPSASQTIALRALHTAMVDHGETYRGQFAVHIDCWRNAAYAAGIADTADAKRKAFLRSRKELVAAGDVKCDEDLYWFADTGKQGSAALLFAAKMKQSDK